MALLIVMKQRWGEGGIPDLGLQGQELSLSEVGPWVAGEACSMALRGQLCGE